jgi:hypothetical protein
MLLVAGPFLQRYRLQKGENSPDILWSCAKVILARVRLRPEQRSMLLTASTELTHVHSACGVMV